MKNKKFKYGQINIFKKIFKLEILFFVINVVGIIIRAIHVLPIMH